MEAVLEKQMTINEFIEYDGFEENYYYELIEGMPIQRSSPAIQHQRISRKILVFLDKYINDNNKGEVFYAPVDVHLDEYNLYQPDIVFVSTKKAHIITKIGIEGIPDLVVEILSPSTSKYDRGDKMKVYRRSGVEEYWIIDPKSQSVEVYVYNQAERDFDLDGYAVEKGPLPSKLFPNLDLDIESIFE
jgi:Uma2 family endonuclease